MVRSLGIALVLIGVALPAFGARQPAQKAFLLKDGDKIVFLGDSITEGASGAEGYITLVKVFCGVNGYEVETVNAGISGHKSNQMLERLQRDVLDKKPTWVSVSCGVNDVWHGEKGIPLPDYKKNMTEIVDRCTSAGAKVLLLTATPIFEDPATTLNLALADYNAFLRDLAKEKGIVFCDLNAACTRIYKQKRTKDNLLTTDGVHMKPRGYRLMAREIVKALGAAPAEINRAEARWELQNNMGETTRKER